LRELKELQLQSAKVAEIEPAEHPGSTTQSLLSGYRTTLIHCKRLRIHLSSLDAFLSADAFDVASEK